MARGKTKVTRSGSTTVIAVPAAAPVQRRRRSSSPARRARSGGGRRRRRSGGGGFLRSYGGGSYGSKLIGHGVGGFAVGWLEKSFPNLPSLPFIGRKGAIAAAAYFLHGKHQLIGDVGLAAAAISGYELGSTGTVTGDVMGIGSIASQM